MHLFVYRYMICMYTYTHENKEEDLPKAGDHDPIETCVQIYDNHVVYVCLYLFI